jgi:hypothetical protein
MMELIKFVKYNNHQNITFNNIYVIMLIQNNLLIDYNLIKQLDQILRSVEPKDICGLIFFHALYNHLTKIIYFLSFIQNFIY